MLILLFFALISSLTSEPILTTHHEDKVTFSISDNLIDDIIGKYIELDIDYQLDLHCKDTLGRAVKIEPGGLPNTDRRPILIDSGAEGFELTFVDLEVLDTGSYTCSVNNEPISTSVYVFVQDPKNAFLRSDYFDANTAEYVPCKTSRFVYPEDVQLQINGTVINSTTLPFDARYGFLLNSEIREQIISSKEVQCVYNGSLNSSRTIRQDENNKSYMELKFEESFSWPYVGSHYKFVCILQTEHIFDKSHYSLQVTCPRCKDNTAVSLSKMELSHSLIYTTNISTMTESDSGTYQCSLYNNKKILVKNATKEVSVSPNKTQFKIIRLSNSTVICDQNDSFNISVALDVFPENTTEFTSTWTKKVIRPPRVVNETILLKPNEKLQFGKYLMENGSYVQSIIINNAELDMSGVYVYTLNFSCNIRTVEFEVLVKTTSPQFIIQLLSSKNFVVFGQNYYKPNMDISVLCLVKSVPLVNRVTLMRRKYFNKYSTRWRIPSDTSLSEGTTSKGYLWTTKLDNDDMQIMCSSATGENVRTIVRVDSDYPEVLTKVERSTSAISVEDEKEIYEGDNIQLKCTLPHTSKWSAASVTWMLGRNLVESENVSGSEQIANINNIKTSQQGEYVCVVRPNGTSEEDVLLKQIIHVVKVDRPYRTSPSPEKPMERHFGSSAVFHCNMAGNPKPQYLWYKDDLIYEDGRFSPDNFTLSIENITAKNTGQYMCKAISRAGEEQIIYFLRVKESGGMHTTFLGFSVVMCSLLLCCFIGLIVLYFKQKQLTKEKNDALALLYNQLIRASNEQPSIETLKIPIDQRICHLNYDRKYEIDRANLTLGRLLGAGQFGKVSCGWLTKPGSDEQSSAERKNLPVAVKGTGRDISVLSCTYFLAPLHGYDVTHQKMLADELKVFCAIGKHPNVLSLIGAVTSGMKKGKLFVVVELCENGSLKEFLTDNRANFVDELKKATLSYDDYMLANNANTLEYAGERNSSWASEIESERLLPDGKPKLATSDLISFALQIACGMDYLGNVPCIHRDLAARNVLLTRKNICRIADFGMARNEQYYKFKTTRNGPEPYRWMAIEAISNGSFTKETDIWAFGIVLYEIFSLGGLPYPTISTENLLEKLMEGYRNTKPPYCHQEIFRLMKMCWDQRALDRLPFSKCINLLREHLNNAAPQLLERMEMEMKAEKEEQKSLDEWLNAGETTE